MPTQVVPAPNSKADGLPQVQESLLEQAEEWRTVDGWPYEVSSLGRVRRSGTKHVTKGFNHAGYVRHCLANGPVHRNRTAHILVLEAFVGLRPPQHECNHKDGVKTNNRLTNLEWVTKSENNRHAFALGLNRTYGEYSRSGRLTAKDVIAIRTMRAETNKTTREIAVIFGISDSHVRDIVRLKRWRRLA